MPFQSRHTAWIARQVPGGPEDLWIKDRRTRCPPNRVVAKVNEGVPNT